MAETSKSLFYRSSLLNVILLAALPLGFVLFTTIMNMAQHADGHSPFFFAGILVMVMGYLALIYSKWPQLKTGDLLSFGVGSKEFKRQVSYWAAYMAMIVGWLMAAYSGVL